MIEELIKSISDEYLDAACNCYHRYRTDDSNDYDILDEIEQKLKENNISFKIVITDAFDSPGYDSSVLSIAYIQPSDNSIGLETILLERY